MLAERERIEGIRQIEVAWSRVPGAESTGLHTAHPKPRSLSYSFALLPRRSPSFSRFLFSFPLSNSPSPSLPYALRSTVASSSLSLPLHPSTGFSRPPLYLPTRSPSFYIPSSSSSSSFPNSKSSCRFPFRSLSRCYSEWRRSSRDNRRCLPSSSVVAARPLPSLTYLVGLLTLSVNHPPCRTFPASPLLPSPPSSTALHHPPTCPPLVS